jgi:hypothetical protein
LGDEYPAGGQRVVAAVLQVRGQLAEQPACAVLLDRGQSDPVDARRAAVAAHLLPRPLQDILRWILSNSAWNCRPGSALAAR